jgi:predicted metalloprotease
VWLRYTQNKDTVKKIRFGRRSPNLQDRRGRRVSGGIGMAGMPIPVGLLSGLGLPGLLLLLALFLLPQLCSSSSGPFGGLSRPFDELPGAQPGDGAIPRGSDPDAELVDFVSFVLDDVQTFWANQFAASNEAYEEATLVLFTDATDSECGVGQAAMGPFYCPLDSTAYLDLGFFEELRRRFGAPGDFAQAYVIAHELAHHVQSITGISSEVRRLAEDNPDQANELSIAQELQADCLAGVWGYSTYERGILESGDLEEALDAAAAIGDDRIQRQATGATNPETWTHGSSEQRLTWFRRGFDTGDASSCDTFSEVE